MDFKEYNLNPTGKKSADCVVRAIATATGQNWLDTFNGLCNISKEVFAMPSEKKVYSKYLKDNGWNMQKMPRQQKGWNMCGNGDSSPRMGRLTVEEFINKNPKGTFIVSVARHLTCIKDSVLLDTWDCSYKSVGNYWIKL